MHPQAVVNYIFASPCYAIRDMYQIHSCFVLNPFPSIVSERFVYNELMEDTPVPGKPDAFGQPRFDANFKPMYALTELQYQLIINQMANLVFANIEQFKQARQGQPKAQQIATHAHEILRDYDDDMAEIMLAAGQPPQHRVRRGSIRG